MGRENVWIGNRFFLKAISIVKSKREMENLTFCAPALPFYFPFILNDSFLYIVLQENGTGKLHLRGEIKSKIPLRHKNDMISINCFDSLMFESFVSFVSCTFSRNIFSGGK